MRFCVSETSPDQGSLREKSDAALLGLRGGLRGGLSDALRRSPASDGLRGSLRSELQRNQPLCNRGGNSSLVRYHQVAADDPHGHTTTSSGFDFGSSCNLRRIFLSNNTFRDTGGKKMFVLVSIFALF